MAWATPKPPWDIPAGRSIWHDDHAAAVRRPLHHYWSNYHSIGYRSVLLFFFIVCLDLTFNLLYEFKGVGMCVVCVCVFLFCYSDGAVDRDEPLPKMQRHEVQNVYGLLGRHVSTKLLDTGSDSKTLFCELHEADHFARSPETCYQNLYHCRGSKSSTKPSGYIYICSVCTCAVFHLLLLN